MVPFCGNCGPIVAPSTSRQQSTFLPLEGPLPWKWDHNTRVLWSFGLGAKMWSKTGAHFSAASVAAGSRSTLGWSRSVSWPLRGSLDLVSSSARAGVPVRFVLFRLGESFRQATDAAVLHRISIACVGASVCSGCNSIGFASASPRGRWSRFARRRVCVWRDVPPECAVGALRRPSALRARRTLRSVSCRTSPAESGTFWEPGYFAPAGATHRIRSAVPLRRCRLWPRPVHVHRFALDLAGGPRCVFGRWVQ